MMGFLESAAWPKGERSPISKSPWINLSMILIVGGNCGRGGGVGGILLFRSWIITLPFWTNIKLDASMFSLLYSPPPPLPRHILVSDRNWLNGGFDVAVLLVLYREAAVKLIF